MQWPETYVFERVHDAQNRHDLDAFLACFDSDYRSDQPVHPDRAFTGSEQVRRNWAAVLMACRISVPSWCARRRGRTLPGRSGTGMVPASADTAGDAGVTIFGIQDDRILWGRLFMDEVDRSGEGIDQAVREITTSAE